MKIRPLTDRHTLPAVLLADGDSSAGGLHRWLRDHREQVEAAVLASGALLVRGFALDSAETMRDTCAVMTPRLRNYRGGDSPRTGVVDKVYTSTEYDASLEVLLHNELSYAGWCPSRVYFGCMLPAQGGGETQLADGREIYRRLDPEVCARFESGGVTYLQHLWDADGEPGPGKSWQETFETDCRREAEDYLIESGMDFEWTGTGIRTAATKPAIRIHPATGEKCWHNQADQWHRLMPSVKDSVGDTRSHQPTGSGCPEPGNHVTFGDGSEIDIADLVHIRAVSRQCEVLFPWQRGDLLVIDNVLTMHGRKPYSGERRVLVAMA